MLYRRIKKNNEFKRMFTRGKKCFSPALIVLILPSAKTALGVCVSKKHGKSVQRNRIKRLLREAFRSVCPRLAKPCSVVLLPKEADGYSLAAFRKSLCSVLAKEGLLDAESAKTI